MVEIGSFRFFKVRIEVCYEPFQVFLATFLPAFRRVVRCVIRFENQPEVYIENQLKHIFLVGFLLWDVYIIREK